MHKARLPALLLTALVLTACSAGAQTQAKRPAGPPPRIGDELVGTKWQAQSIDGQPVPDPALMTIDFLPGGDQVRGQAGCNRFVGPFASRADKVTLGILRQSRLPCGAAETAQQQQLIDMLHRAWRAELGDDVLVLYDRQGQEIRFVPRAG
jgi:heat shock protein HslJ